MALRGKPRNIYIFPILRGFRSGCGCEGGPRAAGPAVIRHIICLRITCLNQVPHTAFWLVPTRGTIR